MRKAVAVPYIIALVLGVGVIALLGIWFVMTGGKFTKQSTETECKNAISIFCSKLISGIPSPILVDGGACGRVAITPPSTLNDCKLQGYVS
ncbi:MAG: hypothetical protein HYS62_03630 [Candidatus Aenigmarchaeota archaeon]|nr:hypothetical protein [Candidatus Aenigmarchaeota archaeon]